MSHALAVCRFDSDGLILYGEYNGTSDVMCAALWPTRELVDEHWRKDTNHRTCICGATATHEPVRIWTNYGAEGGFHWAAKACRQCRTVTSGREPFYNPEPPHWYDPNPVYLTGPDREDGMPEWAEEAMAK